MNNSFKKGFSLVYHAKVHCPICKEEMYANALICPNCKTDFTKAPYNSRTNWQNGALRIILFISIIICLLICFSGVPIILGIILGFFLYGCGYILIQKIQNFKNYHHK